jgi:hypothetical protein
VQEIHPPGSAFRKLAFLIIIGFAVVFLSGPIAAVLSVVLSFAAVLFVFGAIGFLVWLPFRMLLVGRQAAVENVRGMAAAAGRDFGHVGRRVATVAAFPIRVLTAILGAALAVTWFAGKTVFTTARFVTGMAFLAIFGAVLGAICGVVLSGGHQDVEAAVVMNAVVGAGLAVLSGLILALPRRTQRIYPAAN